MLDVTVITARTQRPCRKMRHLDLGLFFVWFAAAKLVNHFQLAKRVTFIARCWRWRVRDDRNSGSIFTEWKRHAQLSG